jgi:hypothetical protein
MGGGEKTRKKLSKKAKIVLTVVIAIFLIIAIPVVAYSIIIFMPRKGVPPMEFGARDFVGLGLPPVGAVEALFFDVPTCEIELVELAVKLYRIANENDKNTPHRMYYGTAATVHSVGSSNNFVDVETVEMKNGAQYFRTDYRLENNLPLLAGSLSFLNDMFEFVATERFYFDPRFEMMKYQRVTNASLNENKIPVANWSVLREESELPVPIFNAKQEGVFEKSDHNINERTIVLGSVKIEHKHNEQGRYYCVSFDLNINLPETTLRTLPMVIAGTGDPNTRFLFSTISFQVWASGYYKYYEFKEAFTARVAGFLVLESNFHYKREFSYSAADSDIDNYKDAKDFMTALGLV